MICVQLPDGCQLKQNTIEDARKEPEQICGSLLPGLKETKCELYVDDEFEENKVNIRHRERYAMPLIKLSAMVPGPTCVPMTGLSGQHNVSMGVSSARADSNREDASASEFA